ncbi:HAD-IA family hydrolase [Chamaesiphon sp. VAR_48_metabat_403]|uniref:HAD family hydrolase n=1 Tax=Chamaesiphon sp. VAR_48_metabat_403 TaxID=2964700 RepID=UPI00286DF5B5|nr:HAD-IA family hydrolase [Chamaesiphon sp. VAR_48_metabat_403]
MPAILFGSISTIADTSELQRQAFNQAFKAHGLDWDWHREEYLTMLENSGGQNRIADYADSIGQTVDAETIHRSKSEFFQNSLTESQLQPRSGVVETIQSAKIKGLKIAFVTTTAQENISLLMAALHPIIQVNDFDLITNADRIDRPKPDKAAYTFALEKLGEKPDNCIAIEDNLGGLESAISAGLDCIAFPNQNTAHHDFNRAKHLVDRLDFDDLQKFLASNSNKRSSKLYSNKL